MLCHGSPFIASIDILANGRNAATLWSPNSIHDPDSIADLAGCGKEVYNRCCYIAQYRPAGIETNADNSGHSRKKNRRSLKINSPNQHQ